MSYDLTNGQSPGDSPISIGPKWGWFVVLGFAEVILGGIASTNLLAANLASIFLIGAMMLASGMIQVIHGFRVNRGRDRVFSILGGLIYSGSGFVVLFDPLLASLTLSLLAGIMMMYAGVFRGWAGFQSRPAHGWRWIIASSVITFMVGVVLVAIWPRVSLWLLGALLVADLIVQGFSLVAFGLALKVRGVKSATEPAVHHQEIRA